MSKNYYIKIGNKKVPVPKEVYYEYKRPAWREAKNREVRAERERSFETLIEDGFNIPSDDPLVEKIVEDKLLLDTLMSALDELTDKERVLIDALFFNQKTEREYANESGIPHPTIHSRKKAILKKLKSFLENF